MCIKWQLSLDTLRGRGMLYLLYPKKLAVIESVPDPKVRKMSITISCIRDVHIV